MGSTLTIAWNEAALGLLEKRDRFTRKAALEEFGTDPRKGAIEFDPERHDFATPVLDNRYSVIWRLDEARNEALVLGFLPFSAGGMSPENLKQVIPGAIHRESRGKASYPEPDEAAPPKLTVLWHNAAVKNLNERDRYTYNDIRVQFRDNPRRGAVELDKGRNDSLSPVIANTKYSVIWRLDEARNAARVLAVLPLKIRDGASPDDIKKQVAKAVRKSGGQAAYPE